MRSTYWSGLFVVAACASFTACAGVKPQSPTGTGGTAGQDAGAVTHPDGYSPVDIKTAEISIAPPHSACGDSVRSQDEACDDGNTTADDGCAANCLTVDPGFSCTPPGMPCHRIARCGDGVAVLPELCDDRNTTAGDGCSDTCKIELGWKCSGSPSTCSKTNTAVSTDSKSPLASSTGTTSDSSIVSLPMISLSRAIRWKVAEANQLDDGRHYVEFNYRLDVTLLPRPMQIGIAGQPDWQLQVRREQRIP